MNKLNGKTGSGRLSRPALVEKLLDVSENSNQLSVLMAFWRQIREKFKILHQTDAIGRFKDYNGLKAELLDDILDREESICALAALVIPRHFTNPRRLLSSFNVMTSTTVYHDVDEDDPLVLLDDNITSTIMKFLTERSGKNGKSDEEAAVFDPSRCEVVYMVVEKIRELLIADSPEEKAELKKQIIGFLINMGINPEMIELMLLGEVDKRTEQLIMMRDEIVKGNLSQVCYCIVPSVSKGMNAMDAVQWGTLGLTRSVDTYDARCGAPFYNYVWHRIMQSIQRNTVNSIRQPAHVIAKIKKFSKAEILAATIYGDTELETIQRIYLEQFEIKISLEELDSLRGNQRQTQMISLDDSDEDTRALGETLELATTDTPESILMEKSVVTGGFDSILDMGGITKPRSREILRLRFVEGKTLEEVGEVFGVTKERIRQIEERSLERLKRNLKAKGMDFDLGF